MKKILFFSLLICMAITLHAQKIQMAKKPSLPTSSTTTQTMTHVSKQPTSSVTTQTMTNVSKQTSNNVSQKTVNNNNLIHKLIPIPNKIKFIKLTRSLVLSSPMSGSSPMPGTQNKNVMSSASKANLAIIYNTVTKVYGDGRKTSYRLTSNTSNWPIDPVLKSNPLNQKPANSNEPGWNCVYVTQTFNAQSTSFMNACNNQAGNSLIPGTIYTFDDYSKGNFKEYADGRNPITIYTSTTVGNNSSTIQTPNGQTISQGISNIVSQFSPTQGGARGAEKIYYSDNQSDLSIMVSAGGSYCGFSGFGITKQNQSQHHIYITYDAIKPLYSIEILQPSNGFFANGKILSTSSPLIVIRNVTYGTRILANIDIQTTSKTNYDSLHLQYQGAFDANIDFSLLAKDQSLTYTGNIYVVGTGTNIPIVSLQNFQQQISDLFARGDYRTALPIQYQLGDLDGNILGVESATDQFTAPQCHPVNEIFTLQSVLATIRTANDGKDAGTQFWLEVYKGTPGNKIIMGTYYDQNTEFKGENGAVTLPITFPPNKRENLYTVDDFKDGGAILLKLIAHKMLGGGDDWDIGNLSLTFNFMSNKGTPYQQPHTVKIPSFRFSDTNMRVFYFDAGFNLIQ